jgi:uncharacterized membrane-anchored protein
MIPDPEQKAKTKKMMKTHLEAFEELYAAFLKARDKLLMAGVPGPEVFKYFEGSKRFLNTQIDGLKRELEKL